MSRPFADHAIEYDDLNLSFMPCAGAKGKNPVEKWAHLQQEPPSVGQLDRWIRNYADANIGLITGRINGLMVIDCDDPGQKIDALFSEFGPTPLIVKTPRGGIHLYYRYNGERTLANFKPKIDIRAEGGFVVAPYSKNPTNGNVYTIILGKLSDIPHLPKSTYCNLPKSEKKTTEFQTSYEISANFEENKIIEGQRNNYLFRLTKDKAASINSSEELLKYAKEHNQSDLIAPLTDSEVANIVKSVWNYKLKNKLLVSGEQYIPVNAIHYRAIQKNPRTVSLYLYLLHHQNGKRVEFTIIQTAVSAAIGCDRRTLRPCIEELIEKKIITRVHSSTGRGDGDRYRFI